VARRDGPAENPSRDEGLLLALRAGDDATFAALVDGWSGSMRRAARAHVSTDSSAEEVVQDTWLAVLHGLADFRGESSLRTWVYRILHNQAKRRGARERRVVPFASLGTDPADEPVVDPSRFQGPEERYPGGWREFPEPWPEQALLAQETQAVVADALDSLPARQRAVVTLRDVEGFSGLEVSELLGISTGNQRVLLHRGRSVVRAHLERYLTGVPAGRTG